MTSWPDDLLDSLTRQDCVLFVGSGFTKNAKTSSSEHPVDWNELLTRLVDELPTSPAPPRFRGQLTAVKRQIKAGDLLWAAQSVESLYEEIGQSAEFRRKVATLVCGRQTALFEPGEVHDRLLELDARVIITTNYDRILSQLFGHGYTYLDYTSNSLASNLRTGKPTVLHLHGSSESPSDLIVTRLDYAKLRQKGSVALKVTEALTLTRTVLFLGYGLDDPDLQLILENQFLSSGSTPGHYLLAQDKQVSESKRKVIREAFGVEVIKYQGHTGSGFKSALQSLTEQVTSRRGVT